MISIYVSILLSSYLMSFATTNGAQQKASYNSVLYCYLENVTGIHDAREEESRVETAVCDLPTKSYRNSITYNYTLTYMVNGIIEQIPITIEFNETMTRTDTTWPWNYVIEGDGAVTSQKFNGYHARALVTSLSNTYKCGTNEVSTQLINAQTYLAVFPASLSGQKLDDILSLLTYTNQSQSTITADPYKWFTTTINSTGLACTGSNTITYSAIN